VYVPQSYLVALILMLTSMVCWGSWPNFLKKLPGWRLEYFYIDYTLGFLITSVVFGVTLGPGDGLGFFDVLSEAGAREAAFAIVGGFIWNIGNIMLLTAIVIGLGASYWLQPVGNGAVLAVSALILLIAAQVTATAYRRLGHVATVDKAKGITTSLVSGLLIGFFPPFVTAAISVGIGSGAPMVGALWGVFLWGEFAKGPRSSRVFIGAALVLYAVGIATMAIAYTI
jgi:glucose uptake protein